MNKYDGGKGQATDLLIHYLKIVFEASGLMWNADNEAEIETLIDCIVAERRAGN